MRNKLIKLAQDSGLFDKLAGMGVGANIDPPYVGINQTGDAPHNPFLPRAPQGFMNNTAGRSGIGTSQGYGNQPAAIMNTPGPAGPMKGEQSSMSTTGLGENKSQSSGIIPFNPADKSYRGSPGWLKLHPQG